MSESFENLASIVHDWAANDKKVQQSIVEALNRYEKHSLAGKRKIGPSLSLIENGSEKNSRAVRSPASLPRRRS